MKIFCIYDSGIQAYQPPFCVEHAQFALRFFETLSKDPKSDVGRYPHQFHLMELGTWSQETAAFELLPTPQDVGSAASLFKEP